MAFQIDTAMKAALWEESKGKLRALVAVQGSYTARENPETEETWRALHTAVEAFISSVEVDALQE